MYEFFYFKRYEYENISEFPKIHVLNVQLCAEFPIIFNVQLCESKSVVKAMAVHFLFYIGHMYNYNYLILPANRH